MSSANMPPASGDHSPQPTIANSAGSWATYDPPASKRPAYITANSRTTYRPTAEQLARDELRRRYLRRNVYAPILIAALIVVALFVLVVVLAFGVQTPRAMSFIAGMAALVVILFSIPMIILMTIMPIAWLALTLNRRQKRRLYPETGPMAYRGRLQSLLWQFDGLLDGARRGTENASARVRRPLTAIHSRAAYFRGLLDGVRGKFTRSS